MRLNKSLDITTFQEHIPRVLIDLSTSGYIQLFININKNSEYFSRPLCNLKFNVTFGCCNYGKYSLYAQLANIITFNLTNMNFLSDMYMKKSSMSQFLNKEK